MMYQDEFEKCEEFFRELKNKLGNFITNAESILPEEDNKLKYGAIKLLKQILVEKDANKLQDLLVELQKYM